MGHNIAGLLLAMASLICLGSAQSSFYDRYCTDPVRDSYFVGYPPDPSKFVWCLGNSASVLSCNPGTLFDTFYAACLSSDNAQVANNNPRDVPSYVNDFCAAQDQTGLTIPALECDEYYICMGYSGLLATCPTGTHFSRAYSACISPLLAGCKKNATMCLNQFSGYRYAALQCDRYYVCDQNLMPVETYCAAGLYYNMNLQNCTTPELSNCVPDPSEITTTTTTTPANGCGPDCTTQNNGAFFPHAKCNWFYMCFNSTALEMQCECGQYYNPTLKYCIQDTNNVCNAS